METLPIEEQGLIKKHLELVLEMNKRLNLTRIDDFDSGLVLHVEDSLAGLEELKNAPAGLYGDMGTGGGFPGIPLAIASHRQTVLIDARQKKMAALDSIINELGLAEKISTYAGRAELLARTQANTFSVLTARALSRLSVLMELASPLLPDNGVLICYKSHVEEDELADALRVQHIVGMQLAGDRTFTLAGEYQRRILTFKKIGKPKIKLPRLEGQAQKSPL